MGSTKCLNVQRLAFKSQMLGKKIVAQNVLFGVPKMTILQFGIQIFRIYLILI
jgi:hypothetical protein